MVIALDLGQNLGYCYRIKGKTKLYFGCMKLKTKPDAEQKFKSFRNFLEGMHMVEPITKVYYEEINFGYNLLAVQSYGGFKAVIHEFFNDKKCDIHPIPSARVKKMFTKNGAASKQLMQEKAKEYVGVEVDDDNTADAIGVYYVGNLMFG